MSSELFLFVRPPRPVWPFSGPGSRFWPPLAFASIAAALRERVRNLQVGILDAAILALDWKALAQEIRRSQPAYVGIGEEAVGCPESLYLAALAHEVGARVIAGGCFFGHVAPHALRTGLVDVVVHGEGEETCVELVEALRSGCTHDLRRVRGLSFRDGEEVVFTGWREPIADLDRLPFPAYDLLPVRQYGRTSRNHRDFAAIELSRGCSHSCSFCILWRQMGRRVGEELKPCLRTKSPERAYEEICALRRRFGRRYLGWVDPCFNAHSQVPQQLAEMLLSRGDAISQSAWVRADYLLRDEQSGALRACVDAGLNEIYVGIERVEDPDLELLQKELTSATIAEALRRVSERCPQVFTVGSLIYGLPGDTPEAMRVLFRLAHSLPLDEIFFIPLTPLPGTAYWRDELWDPTGDRFREFDFGPRTRGDIQLSELTGVLSGCALFCWTRERRQRLWAGLFAHDPRRRSIVRRLAIRSTPVFARSWLIAGAKPLRGLIGCSRRSC
jgi:anaerobic magnesium-protoporphyrin IX monomethyl ester cyclase